MLRDMSEADIQAVALIATRALAKDGRQLPEYSGAKDTSEWKRWLADDSAWAVIKMGESGIVGVCHGEPERDMARNEMVPGVAHLTGLFVDPDHWGQGYARELVRAAKELLRARGFNQVRLWTAVGNTRAIGLYQTDGWQETGRRTKASDGRILMEYEVSL